MIKGDNPGVICVDPADDGASPAPRTMRRALQLLVVRKGDTDDVELLSNMSDHDLARAVVAEAYAGDPRSAAALEQLEARHRVDSETSAAAPGDRVHPMLHAAALKLARMFLGDERTPAVNGPLIELLLRAQGAAEVAVRRADDGDELRKAMTTVARAFTGR